MREYWVVETIKVYRLAGDRYERAAELSLEAGDRLSTPLLPGVEVPLDEIFG